MASEFNLKRLIVNLVEKNKPYNKYLVGDVYVTTLAGNPADLLGGGTWQQITDTFLYAAGGDVALGATGGDNDQYLLKHFHTYQQSDNPAEVEYGVVHQSPKAYNAYIGDASGDALRVNGAGGTAGTEQQKIGQFAHRTRTGYAGDKGEVIDVVTVINPNLGIEHHDVSAKGENMNMPKYTGVNMWLRIA